MIAKYFKIYELVDPLTYKKYGESSWQFIDPRLIGVIDLLRLTFGSAIINDWKWVASINGVGFERKTHSI